MPDTIAGHTLVPTAHGEACQYCGRRWTDLRDATRADIGVEGWAHTGVLTTTEYEQIERRRAAEIARCWDAVVGVAAP